MKKVLKWIGIALASIAALVGIIFAVVSFLTRDAMAVLNQELAALRSGNTEQAYSAYTTSGFRNKLSLYAFQNLVKEYPILTTNTKLFLSYKKISSFQGAKVVSVGGTLSDSSGAREDFEAQLLQENGQWKIQYMLVSNTR